MNRETQQKIWFLLQGGNIEMILTGAFTNGIAVLLGGLLGTLCKKGISDRFNRRLSDGLGLCVICNGITGIFSGDNTIIMVCSIAIGVTIGYLLKLDYRLNRLGDLIQDKIQKEMKSALFRRASSPAASLSVSVQWPLSALCKAV